MLGGQVLSCLPALSLTLNLDSVPYCELSEPQDMVTVGKASVKADYSPTSATENEDSSWNKKGYFLQDWLHLLLELRSDVDHRKPSYSGQKMGLLVS